MIIIIMMLIIITTTIIMMMMINSNDNNNNNNNKILKVFYFEGHVVSFRMIIGYVVHIEHNQMTCLSNT